MDTSNPRRKVLFAAVSALCNEVGFDGCEKSAAETLTEMLQSCITELGRSTRSFCELAGRTEAVAGDAIIAMVEMGLNVDSLSAYARRPNRASIMTPGTSTTPGLHKILQVGQKRSHPAHIPDHLPSFPDPHAYIRTSTYKQPMTEYEAIREKAASQKRDVERALTRFIAKTGETHTLFHDESHLFPLIACKPESQSYLNALLPRDQIFEDEEEPLKDTKKEPEKESMEAELAETSSRKDESDSEVIDNPYLRPVKIQRRQKKR